MRKSGAGGGSQGDYNQKAKIIHVPNTKIIISQTGESPLVRGYGGDSQANQIHNHPVMIKAVASQQSLAQVSKGGTTQGGNHSNLGMNKDPEDGGLVNDILVNAQRVQDIDFRIDSSTANYL